MLTLNEQFPGENTILIDDATGSDFNIRLDVNGTGNRIVLKRPVACSSLFIEVNGSGTVEIEGDCIFSDQHVRLFAPGRVFIDHGARFNGHSVVHMHENGNVSIGKDCLIAGGVSFSTSHVHKIYDMNTRERLNPGGDIKVGDRVWVCPDVNLWPGADISHDTVIGMGSYVSKAFPPNCIIAGTPAKIVREGIIWEA